MEARPLKLETSSPGEFPGLEAFLTTEGPSLWRPEGHSRLLPAGRACGDSLHTLSNNWPASRTTGPLTFAGLAPLRFVLEVLVGEKLLFSSRPDKLRAAVHAPEDPVLELHRSLPRRGRVVTDLLQLTPELLTITFPRAPPFFPAACRRASSRTNAS